MSEPFPVSISDNSRDDVTALASNDDARFQPYLRRWAGKYIWWKTPDEALAYPDRIIAQVMNIGVYDDVQEMVATAWRGAAARRALTRGGWLAQRAFMALLALSTRPRSHAR